MRNLDAVDKNLPGGRFEQPESQAQDRGFARTGLAEDDFHLARHDQKAHAVEHDLLAERQRDVAEFDLRLDCVLSHRSALLS